MKEPGEEGGAGASLWLTAVPVYWDFGASMAAKVGGFGQIRCSEGIFQGIPRTPEQGMAVL